MVRKPGFHLGNGGSTPLGNLHFGGVAKLVNMEFSKQNPNAKKDPFFKYFFFFICNELNCGGIVELDEVTEIAECRVCSKKQKIPIEYTE